MGPNAGDLWQLEIERSPIVLSDVLILFPRGLVEECCFWLRSRGFARSSVTSVLNF